MTPKQYILQHYPDAVSHFSPTERVWFIWDCAKPIDATYMLGRGKTARDAWRDARLRLTGSSL